MRRMHFSRALMPSVLNSRINAYSGDAEIMVSLSALREFYAARRAPRGSTSMMLKFWSKIFKMLSFWLTRQKLDAMRIHKILANVTTVA